VEHTDINSSARPQVEVSSASILPRRPPWRERERARFADVLDDAADVLERSGELPDAVRWLRKEARAWRSAMR
jgi:hypothetical protein